MRFAFGVIRFAVACCLVLAPSAWLAADDNGAPADLQAIYRKLEAQDAELRALRQQVDAQRAARPAPVYGPAPPIAVSPPPSVLGQPPSFAGPAPGATQVVPASVLQRVPADTFPLAPENRPDAKTDDALSNDQRLFDLERRFNDFSRGQSVGKKGKGDEKKDAKKDDKGAKKEEYPTYKITGFTQLDGAWYSQQPNNRATVGDAQDGVGFRRARVGIVGKAAEHTNYIVEIDFATAGRPSFFDVWAEQGSIPIIGAVRVGQYAQPFGVDTLSGFRNLPFLERSLPFLAFVPFRRVGAMGSNSTEDERLNWSYSVFRTGGFNNAPLGDDRFATDFGDQGGYSFTSRVTKLLYYDDLAPDQYLWHVGASYDYSRLGANDAVGSGTPGNAGSGPTPFYQSRVLPEFGTLGYPENSSSFGSAVNGTPIFVDSGKFAARSFNLFGVETVYQYGPFSFQSEFMGNSVNSVVGPVFYYGAYGEVLYRLTGEHRVYDKRLAVLKNPIPFTDFISITRGQRGVHGWGAWEVAARWSYVDIENPTKLDGHYYNSTTNTFTSTTGRVGNGRLNDATLGLTWFLNAHLKIQFNWIHAMLDNRLRGDSTADLYVTRLQVDF